MPVWRLHWWAWVRWWVIAAGWSTTLWLTVALFQPAIALLAIGPIRAGRRRNIPWPPLLTLPIAAAIFAPYAVAAITVGLLLLAGWKTLGWWWTTFQVTPDVLLVARGIPGIRRRTSRLARRRLIQSDETEDTLGALLGYVNIHLETSAQEEFVDRVRFVRPELYELILDYDLPAR